MFKDPTAPTKKQDGYKEWSFAAPSKDELSSGCITAGNDYGVGFRSPVGTEKRTMQSPLPKNVRKASTDEVIKASKRG